MVSNVMYNRIAGNKYFQFIFLRFFISSSFLPLSLPLPPPVFYTWVARSRSGSSSFTASASLPPPLPPPPSSSSSQVSCKVKGVTAPATLGAKSNKRCDRLNIFKKIPLQKNPIVLTGYKRCSDIRLARFPPNQSQGFCMVIVCTGFHHRRRIGEIFVELSFQCS